MTDDEKERYEERAAIIEFDAGVPRRAAEAMALQEVLAMQSRAPEPAVAHAMRQAGLHIERGAQSALRGPDRHAVAG